MSAKPSRHRRRWIALLLCSPLLLLLLALLVTRLLVLRQGRYQYPTTPVVLHSADGVALSALLLEGDGETLVIVAPAFAHTKRSPEVIQLAQDLAGEFDLLVLDLRGHGQSGGAYRFDLASVVPDIHAAASWAQQQGYRQIGLVGFSLGGAAGILQQSRYHNLQSLVSVGCPATAEVADTFQPWMWSGAGRLLFRWGLGVEVAPPPPERQEAPWPVQVVQQIAPVPLLIVQGQHDRIVPAAISQTLYQAAHEPKAYLLVEAGHAGLGQSRGEVKNWLRQTLLLAETAPPAWAHFLERQLGEPAKPAPQTEQGTLLGEVYAAGGEPLARALVLAATETGRTFYTYSDESGQFRLELPAGRYVPIANAPGYQSAPFRQAADPRTPVQVAAGSEQDGIQFTLRPHTPWRPDTAAISLTLSPPELVQAPHPRPVQARRRQIVFEDEHRVDTCLLYEPYPTEGRRPVILAVYPSEPQRWNLVSIPLAAEGYVVLACGPPHLEELADLDPVGFGRDLVSAWALLEDGRLSELADPLRYGILTGSISSFILSTALPDLPPPRVIAGIGGGYDLFLVLRDLYDDPDYALDERFALGLAALGRPDLYPENFLALSLRYHAEILPPTGLFHSAQDETLLVDQAEAMAEDMAKLGRPIQLFRYQGLAHYPGVEDPPPETLQMYQDIVNMLNTYLDP
ncbi:MAG: alpha/beta fold hydrolase [Chloroflexia bacterium]|nr:alpha/beta fold hydrolase [Chloroflexia bacterium]